MISVLDGHAVLLHDDRSFKDGTHLHHVNFGMHQAQTTATQTHHRIGLVQLFDASDERLGVGNLVVCLSAATTSTTTGHAGERRLLAFELAQLSLRSSILGRNSYGGGSSSRIVTGRPCMAVKRPTGVFALHRQQLAQSRFALAHRASENHLLDGRQSL